MREASTDPEAWPPLRSGISVLVTSHRGADRITRCLESLAAQSLPADQFEVVVILNGPDDGTPQVLASVAERHPDLELRVLRSPWPGVSAAANLGLAAARREYVVLVDDDDHVSPGFLAGLLGHASTGTVVAASIGNVAPDGTGEPDWDNYLQTAMDRLTGSVTPEQFPYALVYNAGKLAPTRRARRVAFDEGLGSGQDVAYWSAYFCRFPSTVTILPRSQGVHYYRAVRPDSISRVASSRAFAEDRVAVLATLSRLAHDHPHRAAVLRRNPMVGQMHHLGRYLDDHPGERTELLERLIGLGDPDLPFPTLARGRARDLAVLFAFPPYADTSAIVGARRLWAAQRVVDVVTADVSEVRALDPSSRLLVAGLVDHGWTVRGRFRFTSWAAVRALVTTGLARVDEVIAERGEYRSVYSRAGWPGSHILAALIRSRHPATRWTAEFADPLSRTITGEYRAGPVVDDEVLALADAALRQAGFVPPGPGASVFEWAEQLGFALADEVLFTNPHQRDFMISCCPDVRLRDAARAKAVVSPHPVPAPLFYRVRDPEYPLDPGAIHLGYFGTFYASRGLSDVLAALARLEPSERARVRLHVFSGQHEDVARLVAEEGLSGVVVTNDFVPYLDSLALAGRFDCLVVSDVRTAGSHHANPYLPSKLSDYLGTGRPIWAIVEQGSTLSTYEVAHRSDLGDVDAAAGVLRALLGRDR